ncbi:MAG: zinc-ribbon domain-containing protein [Candidatus Bathyarchaeia archaeon]
MNSRGIGMGEAFSAGLGIALGLVMGQYMLQTMRPPEKVVVERILICQKCAAQNPIENKFCGNCGQSLYPPPQITCKKCDSKMPATMKFCGNCGSALPK